MLIKIGDITNKYGLSHKTLHYWEDSGLFKSSRNEAGYRFYDDDAIDRIRQIIILRKMQISIKDIIRIYESKEMSTVVEVFVNRINEIEEEIVTLTELKHIVNEFLQTMIKSGITKISALPLLYEEMDKQMTAWKEQEEKRTSYRTLSEISDRLTREPDIRIVMLPEMTMLSSQRKCDGISDTDAFWQWVIDHHVDFGVPGSHVLFEQQSNHNGQPMMLVKCSDETGEDCPYQMRHFDGGIFAAASAYTDEDLSQFLKRMIAMLSENKYYEVDYNSEGGLREDVLIETVISPDELREKVDLFLPVKKRVANAVHYREKEQAMIEIGAEELLRQNPALGAIKVDLNKMAYTGMRRIENTDMYDYKFFDYNDRNEIELHSYLLARRLITHEQVAIPCMIEMNCVIHNVGMELELSYHAGRFLLKFHQDRLEIAFSDPVFDEHTELKCEYPKAFQFGKNAVIKWLIGEKQYALILNGETICCAVNMTYMQINRNTFLPHSVKIAAAHGFDFITIRSINLHLIAPKKKSNIKKGELQMIIKQTNNMLENTHPLCTWHYGENYPFNACMKHLMEYVEPNALYSYSFFAGISGDNFIQVYGHDYSSYNNCLSVVWDGEEFVKNVFEQIGYGYTYVKSEQIRANKIMYIETLKAYIDRGIPVLRRSMSEPGNRNWQLYVGYEENGRTLLFLEGDSAEPSKQDTEKVFFEDWIFIGEKKQEINPEQIYTNALIRIADLLTAPDRFDCAYGANAFKAWADDIENGRFEKIAQEDFDEWRDYTIYVCNFSTNFCGISFDFLTKVKEAVPKFASVFEKYQAISQIDIKLEELGGNFNVTLANLQNKEKRTAIANEIRKYIEPFKSFAKFLRDITRK